MILKTFYRLNLIEVNEIEKELKEEHCDSEGRTSVELKVVEMHHPVGDKKDALMSGYFWR